jgi:HEPN domain-containing protein
MTEPASGPKGSLNFVAASAYPGVNLMLYSAKDDYLASRLCLRAGLHTGTALAAQAIEKTMKGILCFFDGKRFSGSVQTHELPKLNSELRKRSLSAAVADDAPLRKFEAFFWDRYPDKKSNEHFPDSIGYWDTLHELDGIIMRLWENMPPSVGAVGSGVLAVFGNPKTLEHRILLEDNIFADRWAALYATQKQAYLDHTKIRLDLWELPVDELEALSQHGKAAIEVPIEAILARSVIRQKKAGISD